MRARFYMPCRVHWDASGMALFLIPMNINVFSPDFRANPYPAYAHMLPHAVYEVRYDGWTDYVVTQYEHVAALLRDPRLVRTGTADGDWTPPDHWLPYFQMTDHWMLMRNPPDHTRLRGLVNKAFTPAAINLLRGRIEQVADALIDALPEHGAFDLIGAYAFELPVRVIADMLGVPVADRERFKHWSNALAAAIDFNNDNRVLDVAAQSAREMTVYMRELIAEKRARPSDDILSGMIHAEEQGDRLSEDEVIANCGLLLFAGHETTVNLIGNGVYTLLRHPDQLVRLRREPALLPGAVEEILRYESPVQATSRYVAEDVQVGPDVLPKGVNVTLVMAAANRDPRQFTQPDRFDLTRNEARHQTFGGGIHYCVGAPLARMEGQIGLACLLARLPGLRLAGEEFEWRDNFILRGLKALPVAAE
jgi:pimeloyl-[acyl-carrier protein] synthase